MSHLSDFKFSNLFRQVVILAALSLPLAVHAEEVGTSYSLLSVVLISISGALVGFWSACYRPWFLAIALPVLIGFFAYHLWATYDVVDIKALRTQDEIAYLALSWFGLPVLLAGFALGRFVRARRKKKTNVDSIFQPSIFDTD